MLFRSTTVERFGQTVLKRGIVPESVSDCHVQTDVFCNRYDTWKLRPTPIRCGPRGISLYALRARGTPGSSSILGVKDLVCVREVLRRGWGPEQTVIGLHLVERGIPVWLGFSEDRSTVPVPSQYVSPLYRPQGYIFSLEDYKSYVKRQLNLMGNISIAQPIVREGGILWRLAMESAVDLGSCAAIDSDVDVYETTRMNTGRKHWVAAALPDSVADTVVGVYKLYTGG